MGDCPACKKGVPFAEERVPVRTKVKGKEVTIFVSKKLFDKITKVASEKRKTVN